MDTQNVSCRTAQPSKTPASALQGQQDSQGQSILEVIRSHRQALTVNYVADLLGLSRKTLYAMVKQKRLPCLYIGQAIRLDPLTTANWLESHSTI